MAAGIFVACGDHALDVDDPDDHAFADVRIGAQTARQPLAVAGPWTPPQNVLNVAAGYDFAFDNAPPYNNGDNCSPGATAGALTFRDALLRYFPQIDSAGIYNCRVIAGTDSMSLHGVGRAIDIMIPTVGGDADNDAGDAIANWLVQNAEAIGAQTVIWDHAIWRVSRSPQYGGYNGSNPHIDHVHMELNIEASTEGTPWFAQPFGPIACDPLPAVQTVIDEGHACFALFGPASGWHHESVGVGGGVVWTNAWQHPTAGNSARWALPFVDPGVYTIELALDATFGIFAQTHYLVTASGIAHTVVVNQANPAQAVSADGYINLGAFSFDASGVEGVVVQDNVASAVEPQQHIVVDALRVTPVTITGCAPLPSSGGILDEDGPCFESFGPAQFWRVESGVGHDGALLWTNAFNGTTSSNHATWRIPLQTLGSYRVQVYLDAAHAQFAFTHYRVFTGTNSVDVVVDQSTAATLADHFYELGTFEFTAAAEGKLEVFDTHDGPVGEGTRIVVDAIRVVPLDAQTGPPPVDGTGSADDNPTADDDDVGLVHSARVTLMAPSPACGQGTSAPIAMLALVLMVRGRRARATATA